MKGIGYPKNVYLDEFDITVKKYLELEEMATICQQMVETSNYFERQARLISGVVSFACEDIPVGTDINALLASGAWFDIKSILQTYIDLILRGVEYYDSLSFSIKETVKNMESFIRSPETLETINKVKELMSNDNK